MFLLFKETKLDGNWAATMNILRYIINNHTRYQFELESCNALPVFHAFTNCYFGPSLHWIGKLENPAHGKNENVQQVFSKTNTCAVISEDNQVLESFNLPEGCI